MRRSENPVMARKVRGPKMRVTGFPALEPLCNAFATICGTLARKAFQCNVDVSLYGYESIRHGDYLRQLIAPSAIYLLSFPETQGSGLIKAHPKLLTKILDLSLGGDGSSETGGQDRPLTQIDLAIYGRFVDLVATAFNDAIIELCGRSGIGHAVRTRFEEQPGMIRIAPDRAEVFTIKLNFSIEGEEEPAGLDLVIPVATLEPLKRDFSNVVSANEATLAIWETSMRERVMGLELGADCVISLGDFSVGELSRLEQGGLIELPLDAIGAVELRVPTLGGDVALARGRLGANGRHKAVRLVEDPDAAFLEPLRRLTDHGAA